MHNLQDDRIQIPDAEWNNRMFSIIATRYDLLNSILSLSLDRNWRKELVSHAAVRPDDRILDVCSGTGGIAVEFAEAGLCGEIIGVDSSEEMLKIAEEKTREANLQNKIKLAKGSALELAFEDESFDIVSMGFGLRNISDYAKGICEMARVLKNGGRLVVLEFSPPEDTLFGMIHHFYLKSVIPFVGGILSGSKDAYQFLSKSILNFAKPETIALVMKRQDLKNVSYKKLSGGAVYLYRGEKHTPPKKEEKVVVEIKKQMPIERQKKEPKKSVSQGDLFGNP